MTAELLYQTLLDAGVSLSYLPWGRLRYSAPKGVLLPPLRAAMAEHKAALALLARDAALAALPVRTWVVGATLTTQTLGVITLGAPTHAAVPTPCTTYLGQACGVKACQWLVGTLPSGRRVSLRFAPSRLCVGCHERRMANWRRKGKRQTPEEEGPGDGSMDPV